MNVYPNAKEEGQGPSTCRINEQTLNERCRKEVTPARSNNWRLVGKRAAGIGGSFDCVAKYLDCVIEFPRGQCPRFVLLYLLNSHQQITEP